MDPITTKILIIVGLLFMTLSAALLPLFCLKLTSRIKRRSRKRMHNAADSLCHKLRICNSAVRNESLELESKSAIDNEDPKSSTVQVRRVRFRKKTLLSVLNCFAGGIFLGTSFIGILPEVRKGFSKAKITWPDLTNSPNPGNGTSDHEDEELMPIAEMFVVAGLFFILCVEQTAHSCNHWRQKRKARICQKRTKAVLRMNSKKEYFVEEGLASSPPLTSSASLSDVSDAKQRHDHSGIRSLILVATLSVHALLEGMAIGLQKTTSNIVVIFIGVLFHKSLIAFSMGSNLVHSKQPIKKILAAAFIISLASPIGIAIGIGINFSGGNSDGAELLNAVLQAIATGTFLYITFFEVLVHEFEAHGNRLAKVLSLFLGYGSVLTTFFFGHH